MSEVGICIGSTPLHARSDLTGDALASLEDGERVRIVRQRGAWCRVATTAGTEGFTHAERIARVAARGLLVTDRNLHEAFVECEAGARLEARSGAQAQAIARAWNLYGGMLQELATRIGIDPAVAAAVLVVESAGQAYGPDGRVVIRFENHIFRRYLGEARRAEFNRHFQVGGDQPWLGHLYRRTPSEPWRAFHGSQALEWDALEVARRLDDRAALSSISMGLPQVMGFNHEIVGYAHPGHLLAFMAADVRYQVLALFDFIRGGQTTSRAVTALRAGDYDTFASIYNGPGQARYYGELIASHVAAFHSLRPGKAPAKPKATTPSATSTTSPTSSTTTGTLASTATASSGGGTYLVRPGDTLGAIAGRFGVTTDALAALNGIRDVNLIHVGQALAIPPAIAAPPAVVVPSAPPVDLTEDDTPTRSYIVRPGDTLGAIARDHGTTVAAIAAANAIQDVNRIFPGQVIAIP